MSILYNSEDQWSDHRIDAHVGGVSCLDRVFVVEVEGKSRVTTDRTDVHGSRDPNWTGFVSFWLYHRPGLAVSGEPSMISWWPPSFGS